MTGNIKTQLYRKNTGARDGEQTKPSQNRVGQKKQNWFDKVESGCVIFSKISIVFINASGRRPNGVRSVN